MSESFRRSTGRMVVSRASAKRLGVVKHLLIDAEQRQIAAVVMGRGKKAQLVDWDQLSGFGPDAVMIVSEDVLRPPGSDRERAAAQQRSGLDVAIADEQVLKLSGVGVEGNVVDLAELVAPFAQGSLADELEVSLGIRIWAWRIARRMMRRST